MYVHGVPDGLVLMTSNRAIPVPAVVATAVGVQPGSLPLAMNVHPPRRLVSITPKEL